MTRPQFVRRSITAEQVALCADLLRLAPATADAVRAVLLRGATHDAAGQAAGVLRPHVTRALSAVRRLDAAIRDAYPARQEPRQRVREGADMPT